MNPVVAENRLPGTRDWPRPALSREIEGYASATSVDCGEPIDLFVNTGAADFVLEVFRMGWYQGAGARRVSGPHRLAGTVQPMPEANAATGLVDCAWTRPVTLQTADAAGAWTSGVYLARLTASESLAQSYIIFVVRDDCRRADLLVQLGVTTYQAYNPWGGKSLDHWGSTGRQRAARVSFNRPYAANPQNPAAAFGMGASGYLSNLQPNSPDYPVSNAGWDCNWVRWLEREGFDCAYATNLDTHAATGLIPRHRAFLSIGHDEYWSWEMREHVEAARDAGVHLGFVTANCADWQIRLEPSTASNSANRVMVCHKKARCDPLFARGADASRLTDTWRSAVVGRPEEQLIGVMHAGDPVDADIVVAAAGHWVFDATGLAAGSRLRGLLGYEVDCVHDTAGSRCQRLAEPPGVAANDAARHGVAHMSLYTAPSGALVFATGSMQWAWGLDDLNVPGLRTSRRSDAAEQVTRNVLGRFVDRSRVKSQWGAPEVTVQMKAMRFGVWPGANRSDTEWYREDLQRRHGPKGAASCAVTFGAPHEGVPGRLEPASATSRSRPGTRPSGCR